MPAVPLRVEPATPLAAGFDAIRAELGIAPGFPPDVLAEADAAARDGPSAQGEARTDRRDVPFVTVDPAGSMDLDQAVSLRRRPGGGYLVSYAVADVAAFVRPGALVDGEARRRGMTVYLPDRRAPLHPLTLSEGAASLLPDGDRPALVWDFELDADGRPSGSGARVERAEVRSRTKLSYDGVQQALDAGTADDQLRLLAEVGRRRQQLEIERGGVSLALPEQQVVGEGGRYQLSYRAPLPVEGWNAQLSLLTGMCAARLMLDGRIGVLRVVPHPPPEVLAILQRRARALGVRWAPGESYADVVRSLDPTLPGHAAFAVQAARLFRGASYLSFDGTSPSGPAAEHAAVAAPYAHVTAPLRRLADRFANEVVLALSADREVPGWVRDALPLLPDLMARAAQREGAAGAMAHDLVEASVLVGSVGSVMDGVVVDVHHGASRVQVREPAVVATVHQDLPLGAEVRLRVMDVDVAERRVTFAVA